MYRYLIVHNQRGYTLIESLFQLAIFAVFVQLLVLFFLWKSPIEKQYSSMTNTAWELFVVDMQAALIDVHKFDIHANSRGLQLVNNRGVIDIEQNHNVIRKKVDGLGHVPFLTDVQSTIFTFDGTTLLIDVTMLDGTRKERDFAVGFYPK